MSGQKLYVVVGGWDYEGYSKVSYISCDIKKAKKARDAIVSGNRYDSIDIFEIEMDVMDGAKLIENPQPIPSTQTTEGPQTPQGNKAQQEALSEKGKVQNQ